MSRGGASIPFFTDHDVPDSVGKSLVAAGHQVIRLRDQMATESADEVVATACREAGYVLVTHNIRDFQKILRDRLQMTKKQAMQFSRLELACSPTEAARRVREELDFIDLAWRRHLAAPKHGMAVTIGSSWIRMDRGPERITPKQRQARPKAKGA